MQAIPRKDIRFDNRALRRSSRADKKSLRFWKNIRCDFALNSKSSDVFDLNLITANHARNNGNFRRRAERCFLKDY